MSITLWVVAGLLTVGFLLSGAFKIVQPRTKLIDHGFRWVEDFSPLQVKLIGIAETLGGVGLIVPAAVGILAPLTPLAAVGLTLLMIGGVIVHIRRREHSNLATVLTLGTITAALAILRSGPYPF